MKSNDDLTEEERESLRLHAAGATVRHQNPFSALPVPVNASPLSQDVLQKWVIPFYGPSVKVRSLGFMAACAEVTSEITRLLLAEFNWRPRIVAATFVAVRQFSELQPLISTLLLRSDVCFAGREYCIALAAFSNEAAAETLVTYLDYYLARPDLDFDQIEALVALQHLDERRGTTYAEQFTQSWQRFTQDKPYWNVDQHRNQFRNDLNAIEEMRRRIEG